jgi:hypothetical protein
MVWNRLQMWRLRCILFGFLFLPLVGCSKEDLQKVVDDVKTRAESVSKDAIQAAPTLIGPTGSIKISMEQEIVTSAANAKLLLVGAGRENFFQIRSSKSSNDEFLPIVFFQGTTKANSWSALQGQNISGQLFIQTDREMGLWKIAGNEKCVLRVLSMQDSEVIGEIERTPMISVGGQTQYVKGSFRAVTMNP